MYIKKDRVRVIKQDASRRKKEIQ